MAFQPSIAPVIDAGIIHEKRSSTADRVAATTTDNSIRIVSPSEYAEAALSLAESFRYDESVRYAIDTPDRTHWSEERRFALHLQALEYITYAHCLKGLVTTVGENYGCVALWMPPGKTMDDWLTLLQSGMWRLNYKLSAQGKKRFFDEFLPLLHDVKAEVMGKRDDDCWYLVYIGTRPESRGKGYCRRLIEHVTKQADVEGRACYLESSNDVNPAIYGKLGFDVVKTIHLQEGNQIRLDIMVREPVHGAPYPTKKMSPPAEKSERVGKTN